MGIEASGHLEFVRLLEERILGRTKAADCKVYEYAGLISAVLGPFTQSGCSSSRIVVRGKH